MTVWMKIGDWEVCLSGGELRRDGRVVVLQEKPLAVLRVLLEQPGQVVTREALRHALWAEDTFVDFDHALNTAVRKLRAALGDSAMSPKYIETVARRGYRLIAPLAPSPVHADDRRIPMEAAAVLLLLIASVAGALFLSRAGAPPSSFVDDVRHALERAGTVSGSAFDEVIAGQTLLDERHEPALLDAIAHFERAARRDPAYAGAWAGLAEANAMLSVLEFRAPDSLTSAERFAQRALAIDPLNAQARRALADVRLRRDGDVEGAERELRAALRISPEDWATWSRYACLLLKASRPNEALQAIRRAQTLRPRSALVNAEVGLYLHAAHRYDDEIPQLERAVALQPDLPVAHFHLGLGYARRRDYASAIEAMGRAISLSGGETRYVAWQARFLAEAGRTDEAARLLGELTHRASERYVAPALIGAVEMALGMRGAAGRG